MDADNMISPSETPFTSMIAEQNSASNSYHEWPVTNLGSVNTSNRVPEGEDAPAVSAPVAALRRGNYTQISVKNVKVSSTSQWVDGAADIAKLSKQITYKMKELKRDRETMMLQNIAALPGTAAGATTRTAAGLPAFLQTNTSRGAGAGANPVLSGTTTGYPTTAAVAGTSRAITEDLFNTVIQACWTSGGEVKYALCGPSIKRTISKTFTGYSTKYSDGTSNKLITSVEIYQSDFGTVQIVPDRFSPAGDVYFIDPDYVAISYGQTTRQEDLAKTGLTTNKLISCEYTLEVGNEAAHGVLADVT
jgi:hypothetical protein